MTTGAMAFTGTPVCVNSLPSDLARAITAAFVAEYAVLASHAREAKNPAPAPMPHAGEEGAAYVECSVDVHCEGLRPLGVADLHSGLFGPTLPALLIGMSIKPIWSAAVATATESEMSMTTSAPSPTSNVMTLMPSSASRKALERLRPLTPR